MDAAGRALEVASVYRDAALDDVDADVPRGDVTGFKDEGGECAGSALAVNVAKGGGAAVRE